MSSNKHIDWSLYDQLLIKELPDLTIKDLILRHNLNMSIKAIRNRIKILGIKPKKHTLTQSQKDNISKIKKAGRKYSEENVKKHILDNYNTKTITEMSRDLNVTHYVIKMLMVDLGLQTNHELAKKVQSEAGIANHKIASAASSAKWLDNEFRKRQSNLISERSKKLWKNESYRLKIRNKLRHVYDTTDLRERLSILGKERYLKDPKTREILKADRQHKNSKLNDTVAAVLDGHKIQYEREFELCNYKFDFKIGNILLEVNGDYWHSLPNNIANDKSKRTIINKYYDNYIVKVLWESEFRTVRGRERLLNLIDKHTITPTNISLSDVTFSLLNDKKLVSKFLTSFHYLGDTSRKQFVFGLTLHSEIIAVAVFGQPIRQNLNLTKPLELTRLCRYPYITNKNLLSFFLSRCENYLRKNTKHRWLVAYSDTRLHLGTIYKASNWIYVGESNSDYQYMSSNNIPMHKKTLYNRAVTLGITEREYAEMFNYHKTNAGTRLKFVKKLKN